MDGGGGPRLGDGFSMHCYRSIRLFSHPKRSSSEYIWNRRVVDPVSEPFLSSFVRGAEVEPKHSDRTGDRWSGRQITFVGSSEFQYFFFFRCSGGFMSKASQVSRNPLFVRCKMGWAGRGADRRFAPFWAPRFEQACRREGGNL